LNTRGFGHNDPGGITSLYQILDFFDEEKNKTTENCFTLKNQGREGGNFSRKGYIFCFFNGKDLKVRDNPRLVKVLDVDGGLVNAFSR